MAKLGSSLVASGAGSSGVNWTPITTLTREVYSREILFQAQPNLLFPQFATRKVELGAEPGKQINVTKYAQLERGGVLTEGTHMESKKLSASQIPIVVAERGNAVATTEYLLRTTFRNTMLDVARLLAIDYAYVTNKLQQDLFYTTAGLSKIYGGADDTYGGRTNRAGILATDAMSPRILFDAVELLATNKAIKFGTDYVAVLHPHQIRRLMNHSDFIKVIQYGNAQRIFNAEIGKFGSVRILESTTLRQYKKHASAMPIYEDGADTGLTITTDCNNVTDIYTGVFFGFNSYGFAEGLPVELRDGGVVDYGRERSLAWYAIAGEAMIEKDRCVVVETA